LLIQVVNVLIFINSISKFNYNLQRVIPENRNKAAIFVEFIKGRIEKTSNVLFQ